MPKKLRKIRTKSKDMCEACCNPSCSPIWPDTPAYRKMQARKKAGLCIACGKKQCSCKSTKKGGKRLTTKQIENRIALVEKLKTKSKFEQLRIPYLEKQIRTGRTQY